MERSEIQGSARQRKETEPAPLCPCLSAPDSALLHLGYIVASLHGFSVDMVPIVRIAAARCGRARSPDAGA